MKAREDEWSQPHWCCPWPEGTRSCTWPTIGTPDSRVRHTHHRTVADTSTPLPPITVSSSSFHGAPLLPEASLWVGYANTPSRLGRTQWRGDMCSLPDKPGRGTPPPWLPTSLLLRAVCPSPSLACPFQEVGGLALSMRYPHCQEQWGLPNKTQDTRFNVNFRLTTKRFLSVMCRLLHETYLH